MTVFSKLLTPVTTTCQEYVHPWSSSCYTASAALLLHALQASFRLYCTVYLVRSLNIKFVDFVLCSHLLIQKLFDSQLALLMKGTKPSKKDIKRTLHGILQSTAFIGCHAVGFSLLACFMRCTTCSTWTKFKWYPNIIFNFNSLTFRNVIGHYNFLTFAFLPTFISSWFAILVERPSRRALLSLYVTNIVCISCLNFNDIVLLR